VDRQRSELDERFTGESLDLDVWVPYYLPHWSSRAESAATWAIRDGQLCLSIPADQPLWCPDTHAEPLRVSCIQSGCFSGPVGSTVGPQPFRDGLTVREAQPTHWGYTPLYGRIEVGMRARIGPQSMFAFWLSGIEDQPERSGEICVAEIFGDTMCDGAADIGMGVHRLRDPKLVEDFSTVRRHFDPSEFHVYAVDWARSSVTLSMDGERLRHIDQAPDYPMQLMLGVFDFPDKPRPRPDGIEPELTISHVTGVPPDPAG